MVAARKKQVEELKEKQGINKMDDNDNSTYLTDSDDENEKNEKNDTVEHVEPAEDVTYDKDISITIKALIEELQETREENDNLKSMLENTNYLVEILNDQLISFHKQLNEMEIKNKINDINNNNNNEDQPEEEENNYMEDGELDDNEENQIQQQIEEEEQPAIKQIKNDISDDKFYIDRNGQKIKFFDPDEHLTLIHNNGSMIKKEKTNNTDVPITYYI